MKNNKRIFLFAGYDKNDIVNDALVYYVKTLSKYGDVIFCMDCNCKDTEIEKVKPYTITTITKRHGEYDFGSYKRAYQYALDNGILENYDVLYLVNDSVFGPMSDISQILTKIENIPTDASGIIVSKHKTHSFMESWFVRLNKNIFMSDWFNDFISNVKHEEYKYEITVKYEHGLTKLIKEHDCSWGGIYETKGRFTYNKPKKLFKMGCPFIKKMSFTRHNGALGHQIKYILKHSDPDAVKSVIKTSQYLYGEKYMNWFLTSNPLKIIWRNIKYATQKTGIIKK